MVVFDIVFTASATLEPIPADHRLSLINAFCDFLIWYYNFLLLTAY